jgi:transposase InsO family protein
MKGILTMSQKEIDKLKILSQVETKKMTVYEGSEILGISERQIYRLLKRIKKEGTKGIIHKLRGKESNRGYRKELRKKVVEIYSKQYPDYGATLFSEMLVKYYNISLSHETVRRWLRSEAYTTGMRKKRPHRKRRERRSCFGELLQFDGSTHDWFEGRGAECCLINSVDDTTGKIYVRFAISENTQDTMLTMWEYIKINGIPRSIYTDRGSVYYAAGKLTDFGRAMKELGIEMIFAKSPQAKGRVERFNRTLQDRLLKALRREGISNIAEANKYLQEQFIKEFNDQFSVNTESADVHRSHEGIDLQKIFCYKCTRQVKNDYTISLEGNYVQLQKGESPLPRPKQNVTVSRWLDGSMHITFNEQEINFNWLKSKPKKLVMVRKPVGKEHPFRKMNQKFKYDQQRRFFQSAALG